MSVKYAISFVMSCLCSSLALNSFADECPSNWKTLRPQWIWCDDFETDKTASYFEKTGPFNRTAGVGFNGSYGMQSTFISGLLDGGSLKLAFGPTPAGSGFTPPAGVDTTTKFREVYYRVYVNSPTGWVNPSPPYNSKLVRAMVVSASDWSQAMIAHVWSADNDSKFLMSDPVSCVSGSTVQCVGYNDFAHFNWLGGTRGTTAVFASQNLGTWKCIEHHRRYEPAIANGLLYTLPCSEILRSKDRGRAPSTTQPIKMSKIVVSDALYGATRNAADGSLIKNLLSLSADHTCAIIACDQSLAETTMARTSLELYGGLGLTPPGRGIYIHAI